MKYTKILVITPKGMFPHFIIDETDRIENFLGAYSVSKVKNYSVAFSINGVQGEYNSIVSKWIGKPFYGTLIVLGTNGKPFLTFDELWATIDEIYSIIFNEVPNAGN